MKTSGFVVGKFAPLHKGHQFLLESAQANCDKLIVFCYANPDFGYDIETRYASIIKVVPNAGVHMFEKDIPHNNASEYDHRIHCATWLDAFGYSPDIVFSSELYGEPLSAFLSGYFNKPVTHRMVDLERVIFPISATMIRGGGYDEWIV